MKSRSKVEIPKFKEPAKVDFNTPFANINFNEGANAFEFNETPDQQADRLELEALRSSILKTIGVTSADREASLNRFEEEFFKESSRIAVPKLENTLFDRGLGGSSVYQGAVSDLLSNLATEAVLQREGLRTNDENLKLNQLGTVGNVQSADRNAITNLINLAQGFNANNRAQSLSLYQSQLPFQAQVTGNKPSLLPQLLSAAVPFVSPALGALSSASSVLKPTSVTRLASGAF